MAETTFRNKAIGFRVAVVEWGVLGPAALGHNYNWVWYIASENFKNLRLKFVHFSAFLAV